MREIDGYREIGAGVYAPLDGGGLPRGLDLVTFDVDGVLIEVRGSYPEVISRAVQLYCTRVLGWPDRGLLVSPADTALWKRAGGFNSDWQLACACCQHQMWLHESEEAPPLQAFLDDVRRRGGGLPAVAEICGRPAGWEPERITHLCCELYGGDDWCEAMFGFPTSEPRGPGLCNTERPIVARETLLPWRGRLGVYTGRNDGETAFALERCGVADLFPPAACGTCDRGWRKPNPAGLRWLAANLGARRGLFAGDNVDDCDTVRNLRAEGGGGPEFVFAGVLGGSPGEAAAGLFAERGADLIAENVNALVTALAAGV